MQSKNVLWLGLLFVLLLTTFCVSKYIDEFHPKIKTVIAPKEEILVKDFELEQIVTNKIPEEIKTDKVDEKYLKAIELVEKQERDIQKAYDKALEEAKKREKVAKNIKVKPIKKVVKKENKVIKKSLIKEKKPKKFAIEIVLGSQTLLHNQEQKLSTLEKQRLKKLVHNLYQNPSSFLRIETNKKNKKFYRVKNYLKALGINIKNIEILNDKPKNNIYISKTDYNNIEISVIKKD